MLPDKFLNTLVAELDSPEVVGIVLGGSYARDTATIYSDVDIACFVEAEDVSMRKRFLYRDDYLVSVGRKNIANVRNDLTRPNTAIWVVPGLSNCRLLLDKYGTVARLLQEIKAFTWEPLQKAANDYASFSMMMLAELVHKIMSETLKGDDLALSYATSKLFSGLTEAVAVQRGILVESDNTYYRQVQESVGPASAWTEYHRIVAGIDAGPLKVSTTKSRSIAALNLYRETLKLLRPIMESEQLQIAERAIQMVDKANSAPTR